MLIIDDVESTPFIVEVIVFTAEERLFEFIKFAVVVAILPFTVDLRVIVFVVVEIDRVLFVDY